MTTQKRELIPGNYYHIYNRGTSKQKIFLSEADKNRFLHYLYLCNGQRPFQYKKMSQKTIFEYSYDRKEILVDICSWVLMNNHFHLLIYIPENSKGQNISLFLSKLEAAYLKYFNQKYNRSGNLFEGRFQSVVVEDDKYLKYLYSYIHLNPLKMMDPNWKQNLPKLAKAEVYLKDYKFSSFHDLVIKKSRYENKILSQNHKVIQISKIANEYNRLVTFLLPTCFALSVPSPGGR